MSAQLLADQLRLVADVQYRIGVVVDAIPGPHTCVAWKVYKASSGLAGRDYRLVEGSSAVVRFCKDVQAALGVVVDAIPGRKTWSAWVRHAYPEVIAAGVQPLPRWKGARPTMSSGFNARDGRGPNIGRTAGHLGTDWEYHWDGQGDPPDGYRDHHFADRTDRLYYCPPVPVHAVLPGTVVYAQLLDVSERWGGPRWTIEIDHGKWPGLGHVMSWTTHHVELHVRLGQIVEADTVIATAGDTGTEGAPHDHHELWRWREGESVTRHTAPFDPLPLLRDMRLLVPDPIRDGALRARGHIDLLPRLRGQSDG